MNDLMDFEGGDVTQRTIDTGAIPVYITLQCKLKPDHVLDRPRS